MSEEACLRTRSSYLRPFVSVGSVNQEPHKPSHRARCAVVVLKRDIVSAEDGIFASICNIVRNILDNIKLISCVATCPRHLKRSNSMFGCRCRKNHELSIEASLARHFDIRNRRSGYGHENEHAADKKIREIPVKCAEIQISSN